MGGAASVLAVVPSFKPPESLPDLVESLLVECEGVLISDDASPCTSDHVLHTLTAIDRVRIIRHQVNHGIARGLNDGLSRAVEVGACWLLTVDQDSRIGAHYVQRLVDSAAAREANGERLGAVAAGTVVDTSGEMRYHTHGRTGQESAEEVVQSGTLWNVSALASCGGFDARLGIDAVDAAACLALRQHGYAIGIVPDLRIEHAIGQSRMIRIGKRNVMVTGHSPERRASMVRNRLRLFPAEFRQSPTHALRTVRRVAVNHSIGLLIEEDRWSKAKGTVRGLLKVGRG